MHDSYCRPSHRRFRSPRLGMLSMLSMLIVPAVIAGTTRASAATARPRAWVPAEATMPDVPARVEQLRARTSRAALEAKQRQRRTEERWRRTAASPAGTKPRRPGQ